MIKIVVMNVYNPFSNLVCSPSLSSFFYISCLLFLYLSSCVIQIVRTLAVFVVTCVCARAYRTYESIIKKKKLIFKVDSFSCSDFCREKEQSPSLLIGLLFKKNHCKTNKTKQKTNQANKHLAQSRTL